MTKFAYDSCEYATIRKKLVRACDGLNTSLVTAKRGHAALAGQKGYGTEALRNQLASVISRLNSRLNEANNALLFWDLLNKYVLAAESEAARTARNLKYGVPDLKKTDVKQFDALMQQKKAASLVGDVNDLFEVFFGNKLKLLDNLKKAIFPKSLSKALGYFKDGAKLIDSLIHGDKSTIEDLTEKYAQKILGWGMGLEGFEKTVLPTFIWNVAENAYTGLEYSGSPTLMGFSKYLWSVSGGALLETGAEVGYEIAEKIPFFDIDKKTYELTGKHGVEGFYEELKMLGHEMFGGYYDNGVFEGVVGGLGEIGSYVYGEIESSIMKLFS